MSVSAKTRLRIVLPIVGIAIVSVVGTVKGSGQALRERERQLLGETTLMDRRQAERAVVRIDVKPESGEGETGSGIVLGYQSSRLYIATAFHVAAKAGRTGRIDVYFRGILTPLAGHYEGAGDEILDLAVIYVSSPPSEVRAGLVPFRTGRADDVGEMRRGKLGVAGVDVTPEVAARDGLTATEGAFISEVAPGSAGEVAGLQRGDLVTAVNGAAVRNMTGLLEGLRPVPAGSEIELTVWRRRGSLKIRARLGAGDVRPGVLNTIGHPPGQPWAPRQGHLLSFAGPDLLSISTVLSEFGMSGGPLFTSDFILIGIVVRQGDRKDTALRIERALEKFAEWRVPYRLWFTASFCSNLETVIGQEGADFAGLMLGAGNKSVGVEQWSWDARLDLMGRNKSRIVKYSDGDLRYESLIADSAGIEEGERLIREVGRAIKQCIPDASVTSDKWGLRITFRKSFTSRPKTIHISSGVFTKLQFPVR